mmetsp:Transcript_10523/g.27052  ORF Transcript_10523/g.27052 Transcript_10523/m.27052 type:complete len:306 (+) Transcript_10523:53-970(+)
MADYGVERTNDDATECKCSAVNLGYYDDKHIHKFWRKRVARKPPIIHRGYFIRAHAVFVTAKWFVDTVGAAGHEPQVVNLGCGFDTLYWRLLDHDVVPTGGFFEVDMPSVVAKKEGTLARNAETLAAHARGGGAPYRLMAADLRESTEVMRSLEGAGFDPSKPTLFVSECVLVYLETHQTTKLLATLAAAVTDGCYINYEMIQPHDAFGKVMVRNLETRGCPLRGLEGCPDLKAQESRFQDAGWQPRPAKDMNAVFGMLSEKDMARVRKLEIFDEIEEWELISAHYCISTAYKDACGIGLDKMPI